MHVVPWDVILEKVKCMLNSGYGAKLKELCDQL